MCSATRVCIGFQKGLLLHQQQDVRREQRLPCKAGRQAANRIQRWCLYAACVQMCSLQPLNIAFAANWAPDIPDQALGVALAAACSPHTIPTLHPTLISHLLRSQPARLHL